VHCPVVICADADVVAEAGYRRRPIWPDIPWSWSAASQLVDLAAVTLGRSAGAAVALGEQGSEVVAFGRGRAVILETLHGDRRSDALADDPRDIDDPLALVEQRLDPVADLDSRRRLGCLAIDLDMAAPARSRRVRTCLGQPNCVQPLVDSNGLDPSSLARFSAFPTVLRLFGAGVSQLRTPTPAPSCRG